MTSPFQYAKDQVIGSTVDLLNQTRVQQLEKELTRILNDESVKLSHQDQSLLEALAQLEKVRDFLGKPENILGSDLTKHGEIAEQIEVHIRNAKNLINGKAASATFDQVGRTAPEDYIIDGVNVQSKFINGINNNLEHVLKHMDKYAEFGRDGSYYQIPKDTHRVIQQILDGNPPADLNDRTINKILEKVQEIEKQSGKSFSEVVKPSISDYGEVQQGKAHDTVNNHEDDINKMDNDNKEEISKKADKEREQAQQDGKPSMSEGLKAGLIGAAIGGSLNIAMFIYKNHKAGKSISHYSEQDWKDLGINFAKGSAKGGVTGFSIYGLTNFTSMGAPMASAFVSASFGVSQLALDYKAGKIDLNEFVAQGQIVCLESGMVALGAAVGQTLIPIPIVGTLIGSFATSALINLTKEHLSENEKEVTAKLKEIYDEALNKISYEHQKIVKAILEEYERLGTITEMAFNFECNAMFRFDYSKKLAIEYGVADEEILQSLEDVDDFFLN
ncbi:hypothetical protein [Alkalihalobacillus deserti]|uniref:hypothetical protein n=1 Tax=Alkalihalobacillus deserti TaxID=2879466 RepID=UPI001D14F11F|nr:hypothetical protein [Alkalihalobacillus deserti]